MKTRKSLAFALAYLLMILLSTASAQYDKWSTELKGFDPDKITIEAVGIDDSRGESVFGFGRRVELITD